MPGLRCTLFRLSSFDLISASSYVLGSDGQVSEYGRGGGGGAIWVRNRSDNHKCIYALDQMCILRLGSMFGGLEISKIQVEAREGRISKGNDVWGKRSSGEETACLAGTGLTPAEPAMCLTKYYSQLRYITS